MKNHKFLKITAIVMILSMMALFLFACSNDDKKEDEETPEVDPTPTITSSTVKNDIAKAIIDSFNFDATKPVGFDYGAIIPGDGYDYKLNFRGYIDTATATNSKMYLDFVEDDKTLFTLSADDEYLYFVSDTEKRRIRNFDLALAVEGKTLPGYKDIKGSIVGAVPSMIMSLVFDSDKFETNTVEGVTTSTVYGKLDTIAEVLGELVNGFVPGIGDTIKTALSGVNVKLTATLSNGKVDAADLVITKNDSPFNIVINSKIDNFNPEIQTPSSKDMTFTESNILNFAINGKFDMQTSDDKLVSTNIATYDYELYVDLDLFTMIRNAITKDAEGKLGFDADKLFTENSGNFYFNLSHKCLPGCGCNKLAEANGSILTLAFSPRTFGSTDFMVSANVKAILPNGLLDTALGLPSEAVETIMGLIGNQLGTNIDPTVLLTNIAPKADESVGKPVGDDAPNKSTTNINILGVVGSVLDVLSDIRMDAIDGLRLGADSIVDLLDELYPIMNTGDINVAQIVRMFFGDANYLYIDVDSALYGVPALETAKYNEMFQIIDKEVGEYKFTGGPAVSVTPVLDTKGNIVIESSNKNLKLYNKSGNTYEPLPLSTIEIKALLDSNMTIPYNYTTVTGKSGKSSVAVQNILDLDLAKAGEQNIRIVTSFTDGGLLNSGAASTLIEILSGLVFKMDIPGRVFESKMTIVANPTITFSQSEDVVGKYDTSKTYKYGDNLYAKFDISLKYADGTIKEFKNVAPTTSLDAFANSDNKSTSVINAVADFTLDYGYFGTKAVNMDESTYVAPETIKVSIKEGETHTFLNDVSFNINDGAKTISFNGTNATFVLPEGVEVTKNTSEGFDNFSIVFNEAGVYNVEAVFNGTGIKQTYEFTVAEVKELPEFTAKVTKALGGQNKKFNITVGRANQYDFGFDAILASIKVTAVSNDTMTTEELVFGEDYTVTLAGQKLDKNELTLRTFQGQPLKFDITLTNPTFANPSSVQVAFEAIDFESRPLGGGEYAIK